MYGNNFVLRGAGSEALSKLNLIAKQLYKLGKLNLLSEGKALNEESPAQARILHILVTKNCFFTFFASVISFEGYLFCFPIIIAPLITNLKYFFLG